MFSDTITIKDKETGANKTYVPVDDYLKFMVCEGLFDLAGCEKEDYERLKSIFITWMCEKSMHICDNLKLVDEIASLIHVDYERMKEIREKVNKQRDEYVNAKIRKMIEENGRFNWEVKQKKHLKLVK
jgi:hypothetical protein